MIQTLTAVISGQQQISAKIDSQQSLKAELLMPLHDKYPDYQGETEFTPSEDEQIIPVAGKSVLENIKINPIPNNYGLITWNGAILTVS